MGFPPSHTTTGIANENFQSFQGFQSFKPVDTRYARVGKTRAAVVPLDPLVEIPLSEELPLLAAIPIQAVPQQTAARYQAAIELNMRNSAL